MTYLVMECHLSYAIVLDEECNFRKVANFHYEVGQTVTDIVEMNETSTPLKMKSRSWVYKITAAAACFVLLVAGLANMMMTPFASVYVSINPELRVDVTRNNAVVDIDGLNDDGKRLIEGYVYKNKELDPVMDELMDRAIAMGYLSEGGTIHLTLDAKDDNWVLTTSEGLSEHLNGYLKDKTSVTIEVEQRNQDGYKIIIPIESTDYDEQSPYGDNEYGDDDDGGSDSPYDDRDEYDDDADSGYDEIDDDGDSDYDD